jgi:hypothetical protein
MKTLFLWDLKLTGRMEVELHEFLTSAAYGCV